MDGNNLTVVIMKLFALATVSTAIGSSLGNVNGATLVLVIIKKVLDSLQMKVIGL